MSQPKFLKIENDGQASKITLARPRHNVLDIPMMDELNSELEKIAADDRVDISLLPIADGLTLVRKR